MAGAWRLPVPGLGALCHPQVRAELATRAVPRAQRGRALLRANPIRQSAVLWWMLLLWPQGPHSSHRVASALQARAPHHALPAAQGVWPACRAAHGAVRSHLEWQTAQVANDFTRGRAGRMLLAGRGRGLAARSACVDAWCAGPPPPCRTTPLGLRARGKHAVVQGLILGYDYRQEV